MPFNGSGTFTLTYTWATEQLSPPIALSKLDTQESDIATALSNCLTRDNQGKPSVDTDWNSKKITNLADATAATHALNRQTADARYFELTDRAETTTTATVGYLDMPVSEQSGSYTLVLTDRGKTIQHPSGGGTGDTYTIPANSSVAFPVGTVISFENLDSNAISIAITSDTMTLAGTTSSGNRNLGQNGIAIARKVATTSWLIWGLGLS